MTCSKSYCIFNISLRYIGGANLLEYIILGILYSKPLTGYDIRKDIEIGIDMFYKASYGSLYPLLSKLLDKQYVCCVEEQHGKRMKKIYHITSEGKNAFIGWLEAPIEPGSSMEAFMARVYFYDKLSYKISSIRIVEYEKHLVDYLNDLIKKREQFMNLPNQEQFYYKLSTLYFGICKLQSIIMWCRTVSGRNELESLILPMNGEE